MPKYQVWMKAHDRETLAVIGEVLIFEHEDRLEAEKFAELAPLEAAKHVFGGYVLDQIPLFSTETRIPGYGAPVRQRCECIGGPLKTNHGRCANCGRPV